MIFVLRLLRADQALGFDHPNLATAMAFQKSAIPVQELPLGILCTRSMRISPGGLRLLLFPDGIFVNRLTPKLVSVGIPLF